MYSYKPYPHVFWFLVPPQHCAQHHSIPFFARISKDLPGTFLFSFIYSERRRFDGIQSRGLLSRNARRSIFPHLESLLPRNRWNEFVDGIPSRRKDVVNNKNVDKSALSRSLETWQRPQKRREDEELIKKMPLAVVM